MKKIKIISLHIIVWLAVTALLFGLLVLCASIPNEVIKSNMKKSALSYAQKDAFSFENGNKLNSIADNYADSILLGVAWNMGIGKPAVSAVDTKYYDGEEMGENYGLYLSVAEGAEANTEYTRYWHGTASFVRVLHLFTDVGGVKTAGFVMILLLLAAAVVMLVLGKHADIALALCLSLVSVQIWNVRLSMEYQPALMTALAVCILCLAFEKRGDLWLTLIFTAGGTAVCFFDFLTAETLSLLLPLMLAVCVRAKEKRLGALKEGVILSAKCGVAWLLSYAFTFIAKWTLATAVTGRNVFAEAISSAGERLGNTVGGVDTLPKSIFSSVVSNIGVMFGAESRLDYAKTFLPLIFIILLLVSVWYLFRREDGEKDAAKLLLLLGTVTLLRFLIVNNHSYIHSFFTYRALAPTVFACLTALMLNAGLEKKSLGKKQKKSLRK